jgi:DNA polymerase I-like protein with 3'-5' exonuclease and polymerase domains
MSAELPNLDLSLYWIEEREKVRVAKEAGEPPPWSEDSIFQRERFCNVERERDRITVWIRENWRDPYRENPDCWFLMAVARLGGNDPRVLEEITPPLPWDKARYLAEMAAKDLKVGVRGYRTWISRIPGQPTHEHLAANLFDPLWKNARQIRPRPGDTCRAFYRRLIAFDGLGSFLGAQIVADAKFVTPLSGALDWWSFVASGPGSRRGLNVVCGRDPEASWTDETWHATFEQWSTAIAPRLEALGLRLSAQDRQNVLCEVSKYHRAKTTGRISRPFRPDGKPARQPKAEPAPAPAPVQIEEPSAVTIEPPRTDQFERMFAYLARRYIVPAADKSDGKLRLVFDTETDGLDDATKVHCIVTADLDSDQIDEYGPDQISAALAHLARADYLVGHNICGYDLPLLQRLCAWTPPPSCIVLDTLIASRLILPHLDDLDDQAGAMAKFSPLGELRGRYSLEAWGVRLGTPKIGADIAVWSAWTPEIQERCVGDTKLCKALWRFLQPDGYSQTATELEHRTAEVCARITADGVPFDRAAAEQLAQRWQARRAELEAQLRQQLPEIKNPNSRLQIARLLEARGWRPEKRTEKTGQPCIDDELLESLPALYPEFTGLAEHDLLRRRLAQIAYGKKAWLTHVAADGRIHGGLVSIGTPHSRAKHLNPNLGQVPNHKKGAPFAIECRTLFQHPGDWVFVCCDQANLQDRGFAHYLTEFDGGAYAQIFANGVDQHWQTAIALGLAEGTDRDKENKVHTAIREGAKRFRYAFLFGAGPARSGHIIHDTVRAVAQIDSGSDLPQRIFGSAAHPSEEALKRVGKTVLNRFMGATPGLAQLRGKLKAQFQRNDWLPGLDGRRVPGGADYKTLNRIVTSSEAIICKRWLVQLFAELRARFRYGWDGDVVIVLWIHDELVCCCRPEIAEQIGEIMVRHAKQAGEFYSFRVPLDASCTVGRSWAGDEAPPKSLENFEPSCAVHDETPCIATASEAPEPDSADAEPWDDPLDDLLGTGPAEAPTDDRPPPPAVEAPRANGQEHDCSGDTRGDYGDRTSEEHADEPFAPIHNALLRKGYVPTKDFPYMLPGRTEPLYFERRYELRPGTVPTKHRPRKTSRYFHTTDGILLNGTGPRRVIYNWPAIMAAGPGANVLVTEGANKSEPLNEKRLLATAAPYHTWPPECARGLTGCHVFYLEDHDINDRNGRNPGREHSAKAKAALTPVAMSFRIVPTAHLWKHLPPGARPLKHGDDVKDWIELGGDPAKLLDICHEIPAEDSEQLESVCAAAVDMEALEWLWPDRFAIGKIGIICGLPDEGKGQVLAYITSRVTNPNLEWPNGEGRAPHGSVILLSAEDDYADTVRPRLEAVGANCSQVEFIKMVRDQDKQGCARKRMFSLADDLERLRRKIVDLGNVKLVLIDPITAYLGIGKIDNYRASDVRAVLGPLKELAAEMRVAIIAVMHFNKKLDVINVLLRISDSLAFAAAARHAYGIIADAEHGRTLMVRGKNNLARKEEKNLAFHFEERQVGTDRRNGKLIVAPFIVWEPGYVDVTATEALAAAAENKSPGARDGTKSFLESTLSNGPIAAADVEEAAKVNGIARRTLFRAKAELGIRAVKDGPIKDGQRTWRWHPPDARM